MRPPTALEHGAERRGIPLLAAAVGSALDRLRKSGRSAESILKDRHFLNERETALVAAAIYDVRVLGDLVGREKSLRQAYLARERALQAQVDAAKRASPWVFAKPDDDPLDEDAIWHLQPEKAIQYFEGLRPGQQLPRDWSTTHRRQAFEMAVTTDQTMLERVHGMIADRMKAGTGYDFRFDEDLDALGLSSNNPQYGEMVFRTNVMDSYTDGAYNAVADDPEIADEFPYWEYLVVDDDRLGDDHRDNLTRGVNGTAFYPREVTFEEARGDRPFNCFPAGTRVYTLRGYRAIETIEHGTQVLTHEGRFRPVVERHINWYEGDMCELRLADGRVVRVTPSHKFWTGRGAWVEAQALQAGDELLEHLALIFEKDAVGDIEHPHPELRESAMAARRAAKLAATAVDLDADAELGQVDVDVAHDASAVSAPRPRVILADVLDAGGPQPGARDDLAGRDGQTPKIPLAGGLADAAHVRGLAPLSVGGIHPLRGNGLTAISQRDGVVPQERGDSARDVDPKLKAYLPDSSLVDQVSLAQPLAEVAPDGSLKLLPEVARAQRICALARTGSAALLDQVRGRDVDGAAEVARPTEAGVSHVQSSKSTPMHYAAIREIVKVDYSGRVYNLGVAVDASYVVEGVLCANCRCDLRWIHKTEAAELGLPVDAGQLAFDPDQPRDEEGQWTDGGGGGKGPAEPKLATHEQAAVKKWWEGGYEEINASARSGRETADIKALDSAIAKAPPLKSPATVYRGISIPPDHPLIGNLKKGYSFGDDGFVAVTTKREIGENFAKGGDYGNRKYLLRITLPAGARALPVKASGIGESILPRKTGWFKVDGLKREGGMTVVDARYCLPE